MNVVLIFDTVALLAFTSAFIVGLLSYGQNRRIGPLPGILILLAMLVLAFAGFSNFMQSSGIGAGLDTVEDLAEVFVFPLIGYALYAFNMSMQMGNLRTTTNAMQAEHSMLMNIVETSPVGIAVVDDRGYASFANPCAWEVLELHETGGQACCSSPGVVVPAGAAIPDTRTMFDTTMLGRKITNELWDYVSPNGRVPLLMSSTPMTDGSGKVLGSVAVFHPASGAQCGSATQSAQ